jgi:hypothetical protein
LAEVVAAQEGGQVQYSTWRKTPTQVTTAGVWFDLSMSPGNPVPNYYAAAPNVAIRLAQSTDGGIYHGGAPAGMKKYIKGITAMSASAAPLAMILCDYLLFYPFVDMSITDPQLLDNTTALSRYTDGRGVEIMPVIVASPSGSGSPQFQVEYTNQSGVTGRVTQTVATGTQVVNGTIATTAQAIARTAGPFLPLQGTDTGVRKIDSVTFLTPDVGLIAFVLVAPLVNHQIRETTAPAERSMPVDFTPMPEVQADAYLNFICLPNGSLSGAPIHGDLTTIWN